MLLPSSYMELGRRLPGNGLQDQSESQPAVEGTEGDEFWYLLQVLSPYL